MPSLRQVVYLVRPPAACQHAVADRLKVPAAGSMLGGFEADLVDGRCCGSIGRANGVSRSLDAASRGQRRRQCIAGPPRLQPCFLACCV